MEIPIKEDDVYAAKILYASVESIELFVYCIQRLCLKYTVSVLAYVACISTYSTSIPVISIPLRIKSYG